MSLNLEVVSVYGKPIKMLVRKRKLGRIAWAIGVTFADRKRLGGFKGQSSIEDEPYILAGDTRPDKEPTAAMDSKSIFFRPRSAPLAQIIPLKRK